MNLQTINSTRLGFVSVCYTHPFKALYFIIFDEIFVIQDMYEIHFVVHVWN